MAYTPWRYGIPKAERHAPRRLNPTEIEFALRDLVTRPYDATTFPYDLITVLNASKMTVSRLKSGATNKAKQPGDLLWQKHIYLRPVAPGNDVGAIGDTLAADSLTVKNKPRFIVVTDGKQVHIRDLKFNDTEYVEFERLDEKSDFLLPLAGYERRAVVEEHPADIKAAKKLKKLYDAILAANPTWSSGHHAHELNLLMTRLLFCFYAENTGIFDEPKIFTSTVAQQTGEDGSEISPLLDRLFRVMNVIEKERPPSIRAVEAKFPYVNGSLFEDTVEVPQFSRTARRQLLECGDLDWTTINPDIFGSMIQTIAHDGSRGDLGMHYTSVPNIMKMLQPLFLDSLKDAFNKAKDSVSKLEALLGRLSKIRVFDPACGSGNFLIIAYKEMRKLEIETLKRIGEIAPKTPLRFSSISLQHFYGIDVVDFACETAKLSLWIAEHQMNVVFKELFDETKPTLPLTKISTIHCVNALRVDWASICPPDTSMETYVCGNPPYQGARGQTVDQKVDIAAVFSPLQSGYGVVDYVACWFIRLAQYIAKSGPTSGAFVATNSICQGEQVAIVWPNVFAQDLCIAFAHTSFKWANNAAHNAGVSCVIVGISKQRSMPRMLFTDDYHVATANITPYLVAAPRNLIVTKTDEPINGLPPAAKGADPTASTPLFLTPQEKQRLLVEHPEAEVLVRRYYRPYDFLYNVEQYVLWISDEQLPLAMAIQPIADRIRATARLRQSGGQNARRATGTPHRLVRSPHRDEDALMIPQITSERRNYLQIGLLQARTIVDNTTYVVYSPPAFLFALLSSRLHRIWTEAVGGRLETRLRYTATLIYNTFPVPSMSEGQQQVLTDRSRSILRARAKHPGTTVAELYNPETMPPDLLSAHQENDEYLEQHVYGRLFRDDNQRLEHLFAMYGRMIDVEARANTLFQSESA